MVPESKLEKTGHGLAPTGGGWYVLNMRDAEWRHADGRGAVCVVGDDFEGWRRDADQLGVNPFVLEPGEPMSMYHWEGDQEAFLVVSGEAVLIIEGEEDHTVPWAIAHAAYKRQRHNPGVTEFVKVPSRGHALTIDHGWQEVAQIALDFVKRFVPAKPS